MLLVCSESNVNMLAALLPLMNIMM